MTRRLLNQKGTLPLLHPSIKQLKGKETNYSHGTNKGLVGEQVAWNQVDMAAEPVACVLLLVKQRQGHTASWGKRRIRAQATAAHIAITHHTSCHIISFILSAGHNHTQHEPGKQSASNN